MAFRNPFAQRLAGPQAQINLTPSPDRDPFIQQMLARTLQNNGRGSKSAAESLDIASSPIIAALLNRWDAKQKAQQQAQNVQNVNTMLGGMLKGPNIQLENLNNDQGQPQAPDNYQMPAPLPGDPMRKALAGALAQSPQAMTALAMQQAMPPPPKPAMTPYEQAQLGLEARRLQDQEAPKPDNISAYQKEQLKIEQQRLQMQQDAAKAAANPLGLGNQPPTGGDPNAPPVPQPHGDEYLQTLPENVATQVKALADGRQQFPSAFALSKPYWQQMLQAVGQYDPTFDAANFSARSKTRNAFTAGPEAKTINNLNTAIGHAGELMKQIPGTASHGGFPGATMVNAMENAYSQSRGDPGVPLFKDTAGKLAQELTAVYRGSGGAERDVVRGLQSLDPNASAETKKAILGNAVDLLNSKLEALGSQYNQGMGTTQDPLQLLNEKAQKVFSTLKGAPAQGGASGGWSIRPVQ